MSKTKDNTQAEVVKYDIVAMNGKERDLTFYDPQLIAHTENIIKFRDAGNLAALAIAHEMDAMDRDGSYAKAGFKSVAEYGQIVFDYKPATVSLYLRSARAFLEEDENGAIKFRGELPKLTLGQMLEMLPLVEKETDISAVEDAFKSGDLNQRMSTKDIRAAIKGIKGIPMKETSHTEKSALAKADKLGAYNKDELPKGTTSEDYLVANLDATIDAFTNVVTALVDVEHNETVDTKVKQVMSALVELRAELNK